MSINKARRAQWAIVTCRLVKWTRTGFPASGADGLILWCPLQECPGRCMCGWSPCAVPRYSPEPRSRCLCSETSALSRRTSTERGCFLLVCLSCSTSSRAARYQAKLLPSTTKQNCFLNKSTLNAVYFLCV